MNTKPYKEKLLHIITELIENNGVTQFYSGFRGDFDRFCSYAVYGLKADYPYIKNTVVLSYMPDKNYVLPNCFDDSIYLLERTVPKRFAIIETNKDLVDRVNYIVAGVLTHGGGAYSALEYAYKRKKHVISLIEDWEV